MRGTLPFTLLTVGIFTSVLSVTSHPVEGRIRLPGTVPGRTKPLQSTIRIWYTDCTPNSFAVFADKNIQGSKIKLVLSINGGSDLQAFPTIDGSFLFPDVPAGTHMLDVISIDLLFPQVRACFGSHRLSKHAASLDLLCRASR